MDRASSGFIDWERYEKMSLGERLAYLNKKTMEVHRKVKRLLEPKRDPP